MFAEETLERVRALAVADPSGAYDMRSSRLKAMTAAAPTTEAYNHFIFRWVRLTRPAVYVETGTDRGRSAAHAAEGWSGTSVVSIDIDPVCSAQLMALRFPNVVALTGDSIELAGVTDAGKIDVDVLFLDSLHEHDHLLAEFALYAPKVRHGGLILLDDIHLGVGMQRAWNTLSAGRAHTDISVLHFSGFGAIVWEGA